MLSVPLLQAGHWTCASQSHDKGSVFKIIGCPWVCAFTFPSLRSPFCKIKTPSPWCCLVYYTKVVLRPKWKKQSVWMCFDIGKALYSTCSWAQCNKNTKWPENEPQELPSKAFAGKTHPRGCILEIHILGKILREDFSYPRNTQYLALLQKYDSRQTRPTPTQHHQSRVNKKNKTQVSVEMLTNIK